MKPTPYTLRHKDGLWIAHAVAFDLIGADENKEKAVEQLRLCLLAQLAFGVRTGRYNCFFPAPVEYWLPPYEFMPIPTEEEINAVEFQPVTQS